MLLSVTLKLKFTQSTVDKEYLVDNKQVHSVAIVELFFFSLQVFHFRP